MRLFWVDVGTTDNNLSIVVGYNKQYNVTDIKIEEQ